jgi:HAD superfamily hydrolase (TIGR01509 family)
MTLLLDGKLRALLVDLDGTLVDTAAANYAAYAKALAEIGVTVDQDSFDAAAKGRNWRHFLPTLLQAAGVTADPAAVAERKKNLYPSFIPQARVNAPLIHLIGACRPLMRTGLVTTASRSNTLAVLAHHGLSDLFDIIVTGDEVACHKPDPEAYRLAVSRLALRPCDCLAFEDSDAGCASARAANVEVVRVSF